ncbi:lytic transglycosylase domain-containing protein [Alcaligenaceae bacterium]|nr:lytic transglycosylase domain-containing protein [Alcaligenaceae bacterium]
MIAELAGLASACAPNIHPTTLLALVQHESRAKAYAIGINGAGGGTRYADSAEHATSIAHALLKAGTNFDAGLAQINVRNWDWLGLDAETVFDPCTNLKAAQTVLTECYARALQRHHEEQQALRAALSCYNTGHFERGFRNGYVSKVLAQAGIKVPALQAVQVSQPAQPDEAATPQPKAEKGSADGFQTNSTADGFSRKPTKSDNDADSSQPPSNR